jgi:ubiquinone/menaquinone biosynthesis C-methylase UbiE
MLLGRLFAALYDRGARRVEEAGLRERRHAILSGLEGDVLEIGAGTGLNLEHYPRSVRLVLAEPDLHMRRKLAERVGESARDAELVEAAAESLPFPDGSFDAVVSTLVLCSVADLAAALAEIRRVLRPRGKLVLIEHVRGEGGRAALQDAVAPASRLLLACSPNRRTGQAVREAGFDLAEEPFELAGGAAWTRPAFQGVAVRRW